MTTRFPTETLLAAQDIRIAFFDIDGVLTDGGVFFSEHGETLKRFSILDGYGLKLLRTAGIEPAVITGRDSKPLRVRLEALGIVHVRYGTEDKLPAAEAMLAQLGFAAPPPPLTWAERLRAVLDVLEALVYLHTPAEGKAVELHCDVKPSNMLLSRTPDGELVAS